MYNTALSVSKTSKTFWAFARVKADHRCPKPGYRRGTHTDLTYVGTTEGRRSCTTSHSKECTHLVRRLHRVSQNPIPMVKFDIWLRMLLNPRRIRSMCVSGGKIVYQCLRLRPLSCGEVLDEPCSAQLTTSTPEEMSGVAVTR